MIGGALGALEGHILPFEGPGFWALISMGAILGGTMRSPLTGILFAVELTHDFGVLLPLTIAAVTAHGFTVLVLKRSILTEKVARRGYHPPPHARPLPQESRVHLDDTLRTVVYRMAQTDVTMLPILDDRGWFIGELKLADVLKARLRHLEQETRRERPLPISRLIRKLGRKGEALAH